MAKTDSLVTNSKGSFLEHVSLNFVNGSKVMLYILLSYRLLPNSLLFVGSWKTCYATWHESPRGWSSRRLS